MNFEPIRPQNDPRVSHEFATLNGRKYHYILGLPKGRLQPAANILCLHGFPDFWYTWRFIIPSLLDQGFRVIAPDLIGYGQTDRPEVSDDDMDAYSWKSSADDMAKLLESMGITKVVAMGHDWGCAIAFRLYLWHRELVSHIISIGLPYEPPIKKYISIEEAVAEHPNWTYRLACRDSQTAKDLNESPDAIRRFICAIHRVPKDGLLQVNVTRDLMTHVGNPSRPSLLTEEDLELYVQEHSRGGMHGPLNWYKNDRVNFEDEKNMEDVIIRVPTLFIAGTQDFFVPPSAGAHHPKFIIDCTSHELDATHLIPDEVPQELNTVLKKWLKDRGCLEIGN